MMLNLIRGTDFLTAIALFLGGFFALALALGFHEASHAFVANKAGDLTPKAYGRLTLNPFKHFDVYGTLMLLLLGFGWAKPVPINPANFKRPKRDFFWVSAAGIIVNLILAFVGMMFFVLVDKYITGNNFFANLLYWFLLLFVVYNINFAVFNLLPIYPLDGFNMVVACSRRENGYIRFMRQYGWLVLIIVIILFSTIIEYPTNFLFNSFYKFWELIF